MRPKGTSIQLKVRRRATVFLLETDWSVRHVARHIKASPSSVKRWHNILVGVNLGRVDELFSHQECGYQGYKS